MIKVMDIIEIMIFSLNPFSKTSLLKTLWEKEKLLVTSNFSVSHSVFNSFVEHLSSIFFKFEIVVCRLFQLGKSLTLVVWERVN